MTAEIINGREIAEKIKQMVKITVEEIQEKHHTQPNITTIKIGEDPASNLYLKLRDKACEKVGINSEHVFYSTKVEETEVINKIHELNQDPEVHGILIQFPVPEHISQDDLVNAIDPKKDVEGLTPYNMGKTLLGDETIIPCTPLAVLKIIEHEKIPLKGKDITVINHSNIVGKPLAALFLNRNATVTVCHVFTKDLKRHTEKADIIVTAAGVKELIKKELIREGCFIIDVAIITSDDGICGDVDLKDVRAKAGKVTPVPGGVGPVTVACSLLNMIKTYQNCVEAR